MSSEDFPKSLFFFGAGASKPAGVGTTLELVSEFVESIQYNDDKITLNQTLNETLHVFDKI